MPMQCDFCLGLSVCVPGGGGEVEVKRLRRRAVGKPDVLR